MLRLFNTHLTKNISPDTKESASLTIQSPTKGGIMRPDKHWVLKTPRGTGFPHPYRPDCDAHPITTDLVNFDLWQKAHFVSKVCEGNQCEDRMLGRRCNDEVELFFQEDEEEFALLKECLEEVGLSVRAFVVQGEKKVRSKRKGATVLGEGAKRLGMCVQEMEFENERKVEFGLVVEVKGLKRVMVVLRVDEEMFHEVEETGRMDDEGTVIQTSSEGPKDLGRVLGGIRNTTDLRFWVEDEVAKEFFDGMGVLKEAPEFTDFVEKKAREEAEQRKKEKKAAKKHRRMMTESTTSASATTPSEISFGSPVAEQEEAVKARQRAKQNEKRKKQHQRRREEQAAETAEEDKRQAKLTNRGATITLKSLSDSDDSTSESSSGSSNWQLGGRVSNFDVFSNHKGYLQFRPIDLVEEAARREKEMERIEAAAKVQVPAQTRAKVEEVDEDSDSEAKKPKVKLPQPPAKKQKTRKDSVKESSDEDDGDALPIKEADEVVYVTTVDEVSPFMERGGNIWVADPDGVRQVSMGRGLQYLGRGL